MSRVGSLERSGTLVVRAERAEAKMARPLQSHRYHPPHLRLGAYPGHEIRNVPQPNVPHHPILTGEPQPRRRQYLRIDVNTQLPGYQINPVDQIERVQQAELP